jgi:hypothetical protein
MAGRRKPLQITFVPVVALKLHCKPPVTLAGCDVLKGPMRPFVLRLL